MRQTGVMIWKELTQVANRARFALQKAGIAAGLTAVFLLTAWAVIYMYSGRVGGQAWQSMAMFGRTFFWTSVGILTPVLSGLALVYASGMVAEEHVHRRLPLLLVTPLGSGSIISAKAVSVFARAAAGVVVGLPLFGMLGTFGGVDARMVLEATALVASNVWLYGCLGLALSVLCRRTVGALGRALVVAVLWNSIPLYVAIASQKGGTATPYCYAYALSPFYTFAMMTANWLGAHLLAIHVGANLVLGGWFFLAAVALFRPAALKRLSGEPQRRRGLLKGLVRGRRLRGGGKRSWLARLFGAGVVAKELASWRPRKIFLSLGWFILFWALAGLAFLVSGEWSRLKDREVQFVLFAFESFGFFFLFSVQAAARIAREKDERTLQGLILTRLGAARIVLPKAASLVVEHVPAFAWLAARAVMIAEFGFVPYYFPWVLVVGLILAPVFCIALGFYYSVSARRVVSAVVLTGLTWVFGASAGLLGLVMFFQTQSAREPFVRFLGWMCVAVLAILAAALALYLGRRGGYGAWLCTVSYASLALLLFVSLAWLLAPGGAQMLLEREEMVAASMTLPAPYVFGGYARDLDGRRGVPPGASFATPRAPAFRVPPSCVQAAVVFGTHLVLLVWMIASSFNSFERQARRAY